MSEGCVVQLRDCEAIGLDYYNPSSTVAPAYVVQMLVQEPRIEDDQWDASFSRERGER